MSEEIKSHLKEKSTWKRGLYMLLFAVFYSVAEIVITIVVLFQFLLALFTGATNARLLKLGQGLSTYVYQIMLFLTFNSDYHPYPFGAWPKGAPAESGKQAKKRITSDVNDDLGDIEQEINVDGD